MLAGSSIVVEAAVASLAQDCVAGLALSKIVEMSANYIPLVWYEGDKELTLAMSADLSH